MDAYDAAIAYAAKLGAEDGKAAATWYEADDWATILRGIADGDPEVLDTLPQPDLSGQWADRMTGRQLVAETLSAIRLTHSDGSADPYPVGHAPGACGVCDWYDATGDICDAYEVAFSEAAEAEVLRMAQYQTTEE